jgi:hypothetical protein
VKTRLLLALPLFSLTFACKSELGDCANVEAARQLVYGPGNNVATKGQALMHESCGQAAFCHSSGAKESRRKGAPHGMDFDMLPRPTGLEGVFGFEDAIWKQVDEGMMPPPSYPLGDGLWTYSRARRDDEPRLPKLRTREGKAILRNWLACGAPVVTDSKVPEWAQATGMVEPVWSEIHPKLILTRCATSGCHDKAAAGDLDMSDSCAAYSALLAAGSCRKKRVVPGDGSSFLLEKVENDQPSCGTRMPTSGPLSEAEIAALRKWIEDGAEAEGCR